MKKLILIGFAAMFVLASCSKDSNVESLLTEQEKSDLIFLRQEEKLAHDVYVYAYQKYAHFVFNNISNSEQTHIDNMTGLLSKYNVVDPAAGLANGVFADNELQVLYNQLIAKVDISLIDALVVGATIEDLDISDINRFYANTNKTDILRVYDVLNCGSRNHLRGFTGQLKPLGATYSPQFLTTSDYQNIISGSHENCGK
ncbi:MAG: DUF2202 domain-containing protein [Saprospiraceae bacterium]|nr:DUF2202 domain-containing protein [Saprospiraceae bacterium]